MLNNTSSAVSSDHPTPLNSYPAHILDIQLLEAPAVVGQGCHAPIRNLSTPLHT